MGDVFFGDVTLVIDGDTIEIEHVSVSRHNRYRYRSRERVRLRDQDADELGSQVGERSKRSLERRLLGKRVRVDVVAREKRWRRVIGLVTVE